MSEDKRNPFNILDESAPQPGTPVTEEDKSGDLNQRIEKLINASPVVLFMKGNPSMPQCGFSANVVGILNTIGAEYKTFDILSDWDIRQGLKEYANWPTYPQLWIKGELVGGNDIIMEMHQSGDLKSIIDQAFS